MNNTPRNIAIANLVLKICPHLRLESPAFAEKYARAVFLLDIGVDHDSEAFREALTAK